MRTSPGCQATVPVPIATSVSGCPVNLNRFEPALVLGVRPWGSVMRVVLQRVSRASVTIAGRVVGAVGTGFCLLVGFTHGDTAAQVDWMAEKVSGLRLFSDPEGKLNLGLAEVRGAVLVVSQFTLYGDAGRGRRPAFIDA